jgi:hypothetical protein
MANSSTNIFNLLLYKLAVHHFTSPRQRGTTTNHYRIVAPSSRPLLCSSLQPTDGNELEISQQIVPVDGAIKKKPAMVSDSSFSNRRLVWVSTE